MSSFVLTPSTELPVTLDRFKRYLRISSTAFDDILEDALRAAVAEAENYTQSSLLSQTRRLEHGFGAFDLPLMLDFGPINAVTQVAYLPESATDFVIVDPVMYSFNPNSGVLRWLEYPGTPLDQLGSVRVDYTAGYTQATLPKDIAVACQMLGQVNFDRDSQTADLMRSTARVMLDPYRRGGGI